MKNTSLTFLGQVFHIARLVTTFPTFRLKGGAVIIWSKSGPSRMEFHRSFAGSNKAGEGFQDNPQGQGGVFAVGPGTTIVLTDSLFENNYAGDRVRAIER